MPDGLQSQGDASQGKTAPAPWMQREPTPQPRLFESSGHSQPSIGANFVDLHEVLCSLVSIRICGDSDRMCNQWLLLSLGSSGSLEVSIWSNRPAVSVRVAGLATCVTCVLCGLGNIVSQVCAHHAQLDVLCSIWRPQTACGFPYGFVQ